ncbi:HpcH/HpaI aldolase/citrate lyase family protein [Leucobacter sp. UCMA 4100]|uniref:HpcH/HpaI aldolase family protein n=1 Tax=Leucobacter sp. UCMA 4100 TaxID=2810534 RepID=UPI0022EAD8E7|nr:HpcH/HpaI aldolase/citrate lyase family protein [Leucobacter sp. UCMA 4100]MDA3147357.1 HpcH/HpaI aldolase/citrate lyase family protein [Leucobacter sp. UCMA 4100]
MPASITLPPTFREHLDASPDALIGLWSCAGSQIITEIVASSGCDWVLVDTEHSPLGLESTLAQLYAMSAYAATPVVRVPYGDTVVIKQVLDLGAQNLLVPMVDSAEQAQRIVEATRYPSAGVRGVGAALARSSRWNRVGEYLANASDTISLTVQIESVRAVEAIDEILAVEGIDAVFIGPADLAASAGHLGNPADAEVQRLVEHVIERAQDAGMPVGVNAFVPADAQRYIDMGVDFVAVGADVALLARSTEAIVQQFRSPDAAGSPAGERASY